MDSGTLTTNGNNTEFDLAATEPGTNIPISSEIVEDALRHSLQEGATTSISNLNLVVVNKIIVSETQRENAVSVRLQNTMVDEVSFLSHFRQNSKRSLTHILNEWRSNLSFPCMSVIAVFELLEGEKSHTKVRHFFLLLFIRGIDSQWKFKLNLHSFSLSVSDFILKNTGVHVQIYEKIL